jgi:2-methylcitrate dehydratase PrpD
MDGNEIASQFIQMTHWDHLPEPVRRKVKMCLVDTVAAIVGGVLTRISAIAADYAAASWQGDAATILLHSKRSSPCGAAFANANSANALDCDDSALYTRGHPGAQVLATALAMGEQTGIGGRELMTAMVVGYEIAHRAARCWHRHHQVWQADGSWGSVACAAVAAHLMKLNGEQVKHALGIAEYHSPNLPMERDLVHPAMVKHGHGWGAVTGIAAAELAVRGFTGIPSLLGFAEYQSWIDTLGKDYKMVEGVYFKNYCSCGWTHMAIAGLKKLQGEYDWRVEDIAEIRVEAHRWTRLLETSHPNTTEEAQFSAKWPLAAFILDGELGPAQILEARLSDDRVNALVDKIVVVETEEINEIYRPRFQGFYDVGARDVSRVVLHLKDGVVLDSGLMEVDPGPDRPGDEAALEHKFHWLAGFVLEGRVIDAILEMLWSFEEVQDVREFTSLLQRR